MFDVVTEVDIRPPEPRSPPAKLRFKPKHAAMDLLRRALARELHDQAGWHLVALNYGLFAVENDPGNVEGIKVLRHRLDDLNAALRNLSSQFGAVDGPAPGLLQAIPAVCDRWTQITAIPVKVAVDPGRAPVRPEAEDVVVAVLREALTNVARHAAASSRVSVSFDAGADGALRLAVENEGGPSPDAAARPAGQGIRGMRERVEEVGGELRIESGATGGFRLVAQIPAAGR